MINIDELIKKARLYRDTYALRAYQNIKAEFVNFEKSKGNQIDEATQLQILIKYCKKLEDSIKEFSKANREDLVADYTDELIVLQKLLPAPVKESEICDFITQYALDKNWAGTDDVGTRIMIPKKCMGEVIKATKTMFPTADGKLISTIVKENLE